MNKIKAALTGGLISLIGPMLLDEVNPDIDAKFEEVVAKLVAAGTITQAEADAANAAFDNMLVAMKPIELALLKKATG